MQKAHIPLDEDELETLLAIAENNQSGRITRSEVRELVRVYREAMHPLHEMSIDRAVSLGLLD